MKWPKVLLGKVLTKSDNWIDIDPNKTYKQVTVRLWGQGVILRNEVKGAGISASRRLAVSPKQFIVSRIDARNGAFGLIPESLNGAVVTNDFPVFKLNTKVIMPEYLEWMSKTKDFVQLCKIASEGTTNRVRLKEYHFLQSEIPLPPLSEQQRIVARIEELAGKIGEARGLRQKAVNEVAATWHAYLK
ncbi:MAG: restriction endonuclease subunit S, partial [Candidatus Roizmanbacteria bacterium]|nr:restriction endonuclease subunit S [Candidatus Roizmanbacteria bacterium]